MKKKLVIFLLVVAAVVLWSIFRSYNPKTENIKPNISKSRNENIVSGKIIGAPSYTSFGRSYPHAILFIPVQWTDNPSRKMKVFAFDEWGRECMRQFENGDLGIGDTVYFNVSETAENIPDGTPVSSHFGIFQGIKDK